MAARIALSGYAVPFNRTTSSGAQRRTVASRRMAASMKPWRPRRGDCGRRHAPRATRSSGPRPRQYLLSTIQEMAAGSRVRADASRDAPLLRRQSRVGMGLDLARQRQHQSAKRGDLTGPNPTDRAKLGTKRHVLVDGQGIPLAVTLTGANVHDMHMVGKTLDAVNVRGPRGPRRPKNICLDKGYDYKQPEKEARARGVKPHIRRRGESVLTGPIRGKKPRRWVVERTNSWHNNFRALRIRWETKATHYMALVHLACALIAYRAATRR